MLAARWDDRLLALDSRTVQVMRSDDIAGCLPTPGYSERFAGIGGDRVGESGNSATESAKQSEDSLFAFEPVNSR